MGNFDKPRQVEDIEVSFGIGTDGLPPYDEGCRERFLGKGDSIHIMTEWFYSGLSRDAWKALKPKEGIESDNALRYLSACLKSWEPKHEHKLGGTAILLETWFTERSIESCAKIVRNTRKKRGRRE